MQTRKIVVEIKTIDEGHCHDDCELWGFIEKGDDRMCMINKLKQDSIGYIRTKQCKEDENEK